MKNVILAIALCTAFSYAATEDRTGFDLSQLDTSADPCVDFYQYACGGWQAKNPLPADKARYNRYEEMAEGNQKRLREILETAGKPGGVHSAMEQQVGDDYAACMDEATVERRGATPLNADLKKIASAKDKRALMIVMAELDDRGIPTLFNFSASQDPHNSAMVIADADQGGLSLPDRDYYLKEDPKSVERRQKYVEYVAKMLALLNESPEQAKADAQTVLKLETELAKASQSREARRDPKNLDHKMTMVELNQLAPNFYLNDYLRTEGAPKIESLNVSSPDFYRQVNATLGTASLNDWKTYVRWKLVRRMAPMLSSNFVNEDFRFNSQYLRGTKEIEPRWKRCVRAVDNHLGEASGKLFVDRYFGPEGKQKIRDIVNNVLSQLELSIRQADWMSDETKDRALIKLKKINTAKLGFPDKYRDYSAISIKRDDYAGNYMRASHFESQRQLAKIGKPVDRTEWDMTPPTVNAYYNPQQGEIVFPAGILQPPMFDLLADDAYSYGAIGRVAGHELTHGFDDEGRKFDADGNLTDWWKPSDSTAFEDRAACVEKQYSHYSPVDDGNGKPLYLNGKLTLGENVADNGGLRMAYYAYMKSQEGKEPKTIDGFSPAQRVFLGYAISRCENVTPEMSRMLVVVDPHSPGKFRLIGPIVNMPEFQQAFSCTTGQPMAPEARCRVW